MTMPREWVRDRKRLSCSCLFVAWKKLVVFFSRSRCWELLYRIEYRANKGGWIVDLLRISIALDSQRS